uniref:C2H2-type domain-containing protein n=1 Tax=Nothobranchius furzeri TaxID=105023 RepID=A0A8C6LGM7_NOTFU
MVTSVWVVIERTRSLIQATKISFLRRVSGLSHRNRVRSLVIQEGLEVDPLLLHIERSQLRWLGHLVRMPPGHLPGEVFCVHPTRRRPRTHRVLHRFKWQRYPSLEEALEEQSVGVDHQNPQSLHLKEEQEELWTSLEGEQLHLKEETDGARFPFNAVSIKSGNDEEKPLVSQLHQQQIENIDGPTSSSADQTTLETGEGEETSRNPVLNPHEQTSDSSDAEFIVDYEKEEEDVNPDSGSETRLEDVDWNEPGVSSVNKFFRCPECGKQFLHKSSLQKHVRVKELKSFSCDHCAKVFNYKTNLNRHVRVHTGQKPFTCELCGRHFSQKPHLNTHMRVHTGQKCFTCELCGQRFNEKAHLNSHMRVHTGQKPFICELCGQRFSQKSHLNVHMRVHTGQKPFACELCGQRFTHKQNFNRHMSVHSGQKPFACELCAQQFTRKATLNCHMSIHTGQNPFACEFCGQRFNQKANLNVHTKVHTGHKPFVCELCGQRFTHKQNLSRHMSVHTGQKPFVCELCGQRFTLKQNLKRHMSLHTEQKFHCLVLF